jgi:hypothetical protein
MPGTCPTFERSNSYLLDRQPGSVRRWSVSDTLTAGRGSKKLNLSVADTHNKGNGCDRSPRRPRADLSSGALHAGLPIKQPRDEVEGHRGRGEGQRRAGEQGGPSYKRTAWHRCRLSFSWRVDETYVRVKGRWMMLTVTMVSGGERRVRQSLLTVHRSLRRYSCSSCGSAPTSRYRPFRSKTRAAVGAFVKGR